MPEAHTAYPPGSIVELTELQSRNDLNGETALLTSRVLENGRHEAFVLWNGDRNKRPEGINILPRNFTLTTSDARGRASAWNELGCRFVNTGNYCNGLDAFECALDVASKDSVECRIEGCDALCLMAWLGLRVNNEGIDFKGERKASTIVQFCLRNIFSEVLENKEIVPEPAKVDMGAGRIPSRDTPVLLLSVKNGEASRFFFYDEVEKVVHECVETNKIIDNSECKDAADDDRRHDVSIDGSSELSETA